MPPLEKKKTKARKQDWSIDEWLELSIDRQKKRQAKRTRTRKWNRKLRESVEFIISSPEAERKEGAHRRSRPDAENGASGIRGSGGDTKGDGDEGTYVKGNLQTDRMCIPEHAAVDGESSRETLTLGHRGISGSSRRVTD